MNTAPALEVRSAGRGFAIFAGRFRLSQCYWNRETAEARLKADAAFFAYWAGRVLA